MELEGLSHVIVDGIVDDFVDGVVDKASDGLELCCDEGERDGMYACKEGLLSVEESDGFADGITDLDADVDADADVDVDRITSSSCSNKNVLSRAAASNDPYQQLMDSTIANIGRLARSGGMIIARTSILQVKIIDYSNDLLKNLLYDRSKFKK